MKKLLNYSIVSLLVLVLLFSLCACFETGVEGAAKKVENAIEKSIAAGGYFSEAEYKTELKHDKDSDSYVYTIDVYRPEEYVNSPASLGRGLHQMYDGYFDEFDNAKIVINIYDGQGTLVYSDLWD